MSLVHRCEKKGDQAPEAKRGRGLFGMVRALHDCSLPREKRTFYISELLTKIRIRHAACVEVIAQKAHQLKAKSSALSSSTQLHKYLSPAQNSS